MGSDPARRPVSTEGATRPARRLRSRWAMRSAVEMQPGYGCSNAGAAGP